MSKSQKPNPEFDPASKRALHIREYCFRYGCGRSKAYEMIASGELRSVRIGGRRLIPVEAAEALLQGARG